MTMRMWNWIVFCSIAFHMKPICSISSRNHRLQKSLEKETQETQELSEYELVVITDIRYVLEVDRITKTRLIQLSPSAQVG